MQKILDRTQESLAHAFATLAQSAKRQQRLYLATIGVLMLMVVIFALVLVAAAGAKQLDYHRALASQNARGVSVLLHQEESFLRRAELTLAYYYGPAGGRAAPDSIQQAILTSGVALGTIAGADSDFDMVVSEATRDAWGPQTGEKLGRLYESAQSTFVTQQAFELRQQATLVGLDGDYAAILPSLAQGLAGRTGDPDRTAAPAPAPAPQPAMAQLLRETLQQQLQTQTGKRVPGKGEIVWLAPYRDPLRDRQVISAVGAHYDGDTPIMLFSVNIPLDTLAMRIAPPRHVGVNLLMTADHRVVASSTPLDASTVKLLQQAVSATPTESFHYGRDGAIFCEPLVRNSLLVGYVPWSALAAALRLQLAVIGCLTVFILLGIAVVARFFGLRLLRSSFDETSRALESETLNHILVSATPVGLCIVRHSDYSVMTMNALATELLGIGADGSRLPPHIVGEFLAQAPDQPSATTFARVTTFVAPGQPVETPPASLHQSQTGQGGAQQAQRQTESSSDTAGGAPARFLQFIYAPARYAGEDVLFCAILDVTAQTMLEQQLRHARQTSEQLLRARTNFFAAMSHEIRTPLNTLLGNLELFTRTPGLEAHSRRLATLDLAAGALRRVVDDILDFSKIDAGKMLLVKEPFRLIDDFESIALSYAPMHGDRSIRYYPLFSPTLDQVLIGDRMRISQIVGNLLSNAFKFTSTGKITLRAEVTDDSPERAILVCRVSDSGAGMDEDTLARLFKPFAQGELGASRGAGGTGLGLAICARLCELMGGRISAESVPGVGSAFSVSIPLAKPLGESRVLAAAVPTQRGTVLILCIEREAGEMLDRWLQREGWTGHVVVSSAAAMVWLRANRPDALIVSGEYDFTLIAALRTLQPVGVVRITRGGPHQPEARGEGVLEVSEFSRNGIFSAIELAQAGVLTSGPGAPAATLTAPAAADTGGIEPALRGLRVLVAEDNPLIQNLIAEQLAELGCVPTIAHDGKHALKSFEQGRFDVVLTDIHMPEMDGYQLLAALRELDATMQVLAFSAVAENEETHDWRGRGFNGYVAKPTSLGELQAALLEVAPASEEAAVHSAKAAGAMTPAANAGDTRAADNKARYEAMLKEHLQKDLPRLLAIVDEEDVQALGGWAHSASGAFVVVQQTQFVDECRRLQRLCSDSVKWTTEMDEVAISLHDAVSEHYGLDEQSAH